jgi:DNA-binding transcriptional LysR family regulator
MVDSPEKRLLRCWNRLPTFRSVAVTQHLPTASKQLHVTAPALSRSIRLLEEDFGQDLFERVGRRLVLNQAGKELLEHLSDMMIKMEGVFRDLGVDPMVGRVRISAIGLLTDHFVLPAILGLCKAHPNFEPELLVHTSLEANDLIARGALDLAFYFEGVSDERLVIERLGAVSASIYCGVGHPLFTEKSPSPETILEHPFSVPRMGGTGRSVDGWRVELKRKVGMHVTTLSTNVQVAIAGSFLTVLPDVVALPYVTSGQLVRLEAPLTDPMPIYAANRRNDGTLCPSCLIKHAVQDVILSLEHGDIVE